METLNLFWAAAGFLTGIAVSFFLVPLWSASAVLSTRARPWLLVTSVAIVFVAIAIAIYLTKGRPETMNLAHATSHAGVAAGNAESSGSMQDVVVKLSERLARNGGSDADWQLLQQSYEFLGDKDAALLAQQHRVKSNEPVETATARGSADIEHYRALVAKNPQDAASWLALAQLLRTARDFTAAADSYREVAALNAMTADSWADYADVEASLANSLRATTARAAIAAALKIDPKHPKALWLAASLALEDKKYGEALKLWTQLREALSVNSPDIAVMDANIAEARALAGKTALEKDVDVRPAEVRVRGTVKLSAAVRNRAANSMTLFVYAKAPDGTGAPLAALRTEVKDWPIAFELTDAMAMLPGRHLSQYDQVSIEARLSSSGQALPQAGDLRSKPVLVATRSTATTGLLIDSVVQQP